MLVTPTVPLAPSVETSLASGHARNPRSAYQRGGFTAGMASAGRSAPRPPTAPVATCARSQETAKRSATSTRTAALSLERRVLMGTAKTGARMMLTVLPHKPATSPPHQVRAPVSGSVAPIALQIRFAGLTVSAATNAASARTRKNASTALALRSVTVILTAQEPQICPA